MSAPAKSVYTSGDIAGNVMENPPLREGSGKNCFAFNKTQTPAGSPVKAVAHVRLDPGSALRVHRHVDDGEIYYIISGNGEYTDNDGKVTQISAGDCTVCLVGEQHGIRNTGREPLVFIGVIGCGDCKA